MARHTVHTLLLRARLRASCSKPKGPAHTRKINNYYYYIFLKKLFSCIFLCIAGVLIYRNMSCMYVCIPWSSAYFSHTLGLFLYFLSFNLSGDVCCLMFVNFFFFGLRSFQKSGLLFLPACTPSLNPFFSFLSFFFFPFT